MRWAVYLAVLGVLLAPRAAYCPACFNVYTVRCRDGAAYAHYRDLLRPHPKFNQFTQHDIRKRLPICDVDSRCDGVCSFNWPSAIDTPPSMNVGDRLVTGNAVFCYVTYICKAARPRRCRELARMTTTTTLAPADADPE